MNYKHDALLRLIAGVFMFVFCISTYGVSQDRGAEGWRMIADGLSFPEGPAWDGAGNLYFSNAHGDWIGKVSDEEVDTFSVSRTQPFTFDKTNGLTFSRDDRLFACEYGIGMILRFDPDGSSEIYVSGYQGEPFNRPNDLAFDRSGNLWFTDPDSYDPRKPDGRLFMVEAGSRKVSLVRDSLSFPNGVAFSPDGEALFVCESPRHRVLRFPVDRSASGLGNPSVFVELPGGDPDEIVFDREGNLYVAHFGGGAVIQVDPLGTILQKFQTPGKKPSNVEFGGQDLRTLFITEDETNAVYKREMKIPGFRLFHSPDK